MYAEALGILLDTHPQAQTCTCGGVTFKALLADIQSPSAGLARGPGEWEHEVQLTCLAGDFSTLPQPGDQVTIGTSTLTISKVRPVPGSVELELVCRDPA